MPRVAQPSQARAPVFVPLTDQQPGVITGLLRAAYAELLDEDPRWRREAERWDEYDRDVFAYRATVGSCLFLTSIGERIAGFGSWDPRGRPEYAIIGHNCIVPEFRGRGLGRLQVEEILRRFREMGVETARVSTGEHPFFIPAQRMYRAIGFQEVRRIGPEPGMEYGIVEYAKKLGDAE